MKRYKKHSGFSLAEMIMILLFVAILALGSGIILPKKLKAKDPLVPHGKYICTIRDGKEVYFLTTKRNDPVPSLDNAGWKTGSCQANFKVPKYANILNVTMVGGGGAGKDASVSWDKGNDIPKGELYVNGDNYNIEYEGVYHITMYGQSGESAWRSPWNGNNCIVETANPGYTYRFEGDLNLKKGDELRIEKEEKIDGTTTNFFCSDGKYKPLPNEYSKGKDGGVISLTLNGKVIASINGSKAGQTRCNAGAYECENRYIVSQGANGSAKKAPSGFSNLKIYDPANGANRQFVEFDGVVFVEYSDSKNNTTSTFTPNGGCGGGAGKTNSTLYPVLRDTIPPIVIGRGGTSSQPSTATIFGSFPALGGSTGDNCQNVSATQGSSGEAVTAVKGLSSVPGEGAKGGSAAKVDGANASVWGAGGGGGAIYYTKTPTYDKSLSAEENKKPIQKGVRKWYQGKGGNGSDGIIIITW